MSDNRSMRIATYRAQIANLIFGMSETDALLAISELIESGVRHGACKELKLTEDNIMEVAEALRAGCVNYDSEILKMVFSDIKTMFPDYGA